MDLDLNLLQKCYADWDSKLDHYDHINRYYYGNTDSLINFRPKMGRSNLKINTNFVAKLVDEECQYSFDNETTYVSQDGNSDAIKDIKYVLANNKADHDLNLGRELICFGTAFEINYIKPDGTFYNRKVNPLNGYMYLDENDEPVYFLHIYKKQLDPNNYIDVYTKDEIYHFNYEFKPIGDPTPHYFGIVPVGYGIIGGKVLNTDKGYIEGDKTIFRIIKTLQDALETNLGDVTSEISDFRNAILKMYGIELEDAKDEKGNVILGADGHPIKKPPVIRDNAILYFGKKSDEDAEWLTKDINGQFVKDTREDIKDLIYSLTSHINNNEKMQSNLSGIALRSRLFSLEGRCKDNEKAMKNILKTRIKCICKYLFLTKSKTYDPNMIDILFTPNIPIDETTIADMISKIPQDVVSNYTKRSWLPRIDNPDVEQERIDKEKESEIPDMGLDNIDTNKSKTNDMTKMNKNNNCNNSNCC